MNRPITLSEAIACSRATSAYVDTKGGVWIFHPSDMPRVSDKGLLIEPEATNHIRTNSMWGAVIGTPGTLPPNWSINNPLVLGTEVVGFGRGSNGADYIDIRVFGTAASDGVVEITFDTIAATIGQTWTASAFVKLAAGSLGDIGTTSLVLTENNAELIGTAVDSTDFTLTSAMTRMQCTHTNISASTVHVLPFLRIDVAAGGVVDVTVRIAWPQCELGTVATSPIPTRNAPATRASDIVSLVNPAGIINPDEQTIFFEMTPLLSAAAEQIQVGWQVDGSGNSGYLSSESDQSIQVVSGGVAQVGDAQIAAQPATRYKAAMALAANNARGSMNETLGPLDSNLAMPVGNASDVVVGSAPWSPGSKIASGYYHKLWFIPSRESDEVLQSLTTPEDAVGTTITAAPGIAVGIGIAAAIDTVTKTANGTAAAIGAGVGDTGSFLIDADGADLIDTDGALLVDR